jgi:hypothetical protein
MTIITTLFDGWVGLKNSPESIISTRLVQGPQSFQSDAESWFDEFFSLFKSDNQIPYFD